MAGKLLTLAGLFLLAGGGCRACSNCCDYLPPVAGSSQDWCGARAGSRFVQVVETDEDDFPQLVDKPEENQAADVLGPEGDAEIVTPLPDL
jgi:hypothetical protein